MVGAINRAATLSDGQQVVVPSAVAAAMASSAGSGATAGAETQAPVSLGTATQEQLEEIEGIGPVTAQKILEFRDSEGGLGSVDDLDQISGIGPATMESLRAALTP
jgi:competence protein ComEA